MIQYRRSLLIAALLAGTFWMLACSNSSEPTPDALQLKVDSVGPSRFYQNGTPGIECLAYSAFALSNPEVGVRLLSGAIRHAIGTDRSTFRTMFSLTVQDLRAMLMTPDSFFVGPRKAVPLFGSDSVPFTQKLEVQYISYDKGAAKPQQTAEVTFTCGPEPQTASAPSVASVDYPVSTPVQPGDSIAVRYSASSAVGLWHSVIRLIGPCTVERKIFEQMQSNVTRTVYLQLPLSCTFGSTIDATVTARDYMLQDGSKMLLGGKVTQDHTPPSILATTHPSIATVDGQYYVGETIPLIIAAFDNSALQWAYWDIPGTTYRDSQAVAGRQQTFNRPLVVRPDWAGHDRLRFWARDLAGLSSDTFYSVYGNFGMHPTVTYPSVTRTIADTVATALFDVKRGLLYLVHPATNRIAVLSSTDLSTVAQVSFTTSPLDLDLTVTGDSLVVALNNGTLAFVNLLDPNRGYSTVAVTVFGAGEALRELRVAANGLVFLSSRNSSGVARLAEVTPANGAQRIRTDAGKNGGTSVGPLIRRSNDHTVLSFDGGTGYLQFYHSATDDFTIPRNSIGSAAQVGGPGLYAMDVYDLYDHNLAYLRRIRPAVYDFDGGNNFAAFTPTGDYVFQLIFGYGYRSRSADGWIMERFPLPSPQQSIGTWIAQDGTRLLSIYRAGPSAADLVLFDVH